MKRDPAIYMIIFTLGFALLAVTSALIRVNKIKNDYKEAFEVLNETKNSVVVQMDESCYEQFTNNFDKTLYIRMRFE